MDKEKEILSNKKITFLLTGFSKLQPIEFIGMTKLLCTNILEEDKKTMRPFEEILSDMVKNYALAARKTRRTIDKILKAVMIK